MQEIDPITGGPGGRGLITATAKSAVGLVLIWACVLCLGQAARFYVHLVGLAAAARPCCVHSGTCMHASGEVHSI